MFYEGLVMGESYRPPHGAFCWHEVMTPDPERTKAFYAAMFGWTTEERDMGAQGAYTMFFRGGEQVGGMLEMKGAGWENVLPHWMTYVTVHDLEAAVVTAQEMGGEVKVPPTNIPDIGRFSVLADPGGAVFSIFEPAAE